MEISRPIYLNQLISVMHNGMIKIVTGVRRCGKSYLLFHIFHDWLVQQGVDGQHIIAINLEDRRNKSLRDPDALLAHIDARLKDDKMHYVLLDEIQWVREFEDVLNSYLNIPNADLYVTGSNAKFLSSDVITEFRGRGHEIRMYPLSFREFMSTYEGTPQHGLNEYLRYGGLPQVLSYQSVTEKEDYLKSLMQTTYLRDIKERYHIQNDGDMLELMNVLASGIGGLTNPKKIADTYKSIKGITITSDTISEYIHHLNDAFVIQKALRYDIKGRKYISTPLKYYFCDLGLRNAQLNFRQIEETHLMENLIYNELRIRKMEVDVGQVILNTTRNGKNVRDSYEVDFVCNRGDKRVYIQSAWNLNDETKKEQEYFSLRHINDSFAKYVIAGQGALTSITQDGIHVVDLFDFLLDENSI